MIKVFLLMVYIVYGIIIFNNVNPINKIPLPIMAGGFAAIFIFLFKWLCDFLTFISVSQFGIICKTPLKTYEFEWSQFQSWGVYVERKSRYGPPIIHLEEQEFGNEYFFQTKYIWLSVDSNYLPKILNRITSECVSFEYNSEACRIIQDHMDKKYNN